MKLLRYKSIKKEDLFFIEKQGTDHYILKFMGLIINRQEDIYGIFQKI